VRWAGRGLDFASFRLRSHPFFKTGFVAITQDWFAHISNQTVSAARPFRQ
jgi:hypothetical protein